MHPNSVTVAIIVGQCAANGVAAEVTTTEQSPEHRHQVAGYVTRTKYNGNEYIGIKFFFIASTVPEA